MFKNFKDKIAFSGFTVLAIGIFLLIFTFISAYGFLINSLSIIASDDLMLTFGEALAPLVATCIRIMYLGVMGWIGSLLTIRGVTIIAQTPKMQGQAPQQKAATKPTPRKVKAEQTREEPQPKGKPKPPERKRPEREPSEPKPEGKPKPSEPEIIVRPPAPTQHQQHQEQTGENTSSQQRSSS